MTILFSCFKLSPFIRVAIASCQRTSGHHNLSFHTFKGPLGTPRPGNWINYEPHLSTWVKTTNSYFLSFFFSRECVTNYTKHQRGLRVIPMTRTPSLEPRLYDADRGTDFQDGLVGQHARVASSTTGSSLGGRVVNREPFNSLGHLNIP